MIFLNYFNDTIWFNSNITFSFIRKSYHISRLITRNGYNTFWIIESIYSINVLEICERKNVYFLFTYNDNPWLNQFVLFLFKFHIFNVRSESKFTNNLCIIIVPNYNFIRSIFWVFASSNQSQYIRTKQHLYYSDSSIQSWINLHIYIFHNYLLEDVYYKF